MTIRGEPRENARPDRGIALRLLLAARKQRGLWQRPAMPVLRRDKDPSSLFLRFAWLLVRSSARRARAGRKRCFCCCRRYYCYYLRLEAEPGPIGSALFSAFSKCVPNASLQIGANDNTSVARPATAAAAAAAATSATGNSKQGRREDEKGCAHLLRAALPAPDQRPGG